MSDEKQEKDQPGNAAAMRDALEAVVAVGYPHNFQREAPHIREYCYDITEAIKKCFAALSAPPRNCDVGTAEEQETRFKVFCESHWDLNNPSSECAGCPLDERVGTDCEFAWAQMPYEADAKKEKRHDKVW